MSVAASVVRPRPDTVSMSDQVLRDRLCTVLFVSVYLLVVVPTSLQSLTAPKSRASIGVETAPYTQLASLAQTLITMLVLGTCLIAFTLTLSAPRPTPLMPLVLALSPWGFLVMHDLFLDVHPQLRVFVYPFVAVALWQLRPGRKLLAVLGYLVGLSALLAITMGLLVPAKGLFQTAGQGLVEEDKQVVPVGILVGFLTHGNSLGLFIGLGVPFIAAIGRPWHRYPLLAASVVAVLWSASRSAIGGVAVTAVIAVVILAAAPIRRHIVGAGAMILCAAPIVLLPFVVRNPEAFTNRGLIWQQSLLWFHDSPWIGLGSRWYSEVGSSSARLAATVFHGHNELVQVLVTGGVVLMALVALLVAGVAAAAARLVRGGVTSIGVLFLVGLAINCALEVPLAFVDNFGLLPATMLPLFLLLFTDEARSHGAGRSDQLRVQHVRDLR